MNKEIKNTSLPTVTLLAHTPDPLRVIFTAVRTCYSPNSPVYLAAVEWENYLTKPHSKFPNDAIRLLASISKMRHVSTFEHATFTFALEGVSRAFLAQLTRHRIGWSYSVQSQRYVKQSSDSKHGNFRWVMPPKVAESPTAASIFAQAMEDAQLAYNKLVEEGIAPEDARYVFPNAATTNVVVSCNLRSFLDMWEKRNPTTHTQWEFADIINEMRKKLVEAVPELVWLGLGEFEELGELK
jgi:thymidylate synthase (FAD)